MRFDIRYLYSYEQHGCSRMQRDPSAAQGADAAQPFVGAAVIDELHAPYRHPGLQLSGRAPQGR
jgi:hypothetical protein